MLIINADDWGRSRMETDAALQCFQHGAITRVSAMVFMEDSERAAEVAKSCGVDVGLHLNLTEAFVTGVPSSAVVDAHSRTSRFLKSSKYAQLLYHPLLREAFHHTYQAQADEFLRIYGKAPSHIDGHHHMHLCTNMLADAIIPVGQRVRRNFSFKSGEKGWLNRTFRGVSDWWLSRNYRLTDYFFALSQHLSIAALDRVTSLSKTSNVELMTHPAQHNEQTFLMGAVSERLAREMSEGTYANV
jgi:chitin disaccharide deacetylase